MVTRPKLTTIQVLKRLQGRFEKRMGSLQAGQAGRVRVCDFGVGGRAGLSAPGEVVPGGLSGWSKNIFQKLLKSTSIQPDGY